MHASGEVRWPVHQPELKEHSLWGSVGGLIGNSDSEISIHEWYVSSNMSGESIIGGLVGQAGSTVNITASYSQGNISGSDNSVGGLIGSATDAVSITASYSQGDVSGNGGFVGGLRLHIKIKIKSPEPLTCAEKASILYMLAMRANISIPYM